MSTYSAKKSFAIGVAVGVIGLIMLLALIKVGIAQAYSANTTAMFPSVTILGHRLVTAGGNTSQFVTIDMSAATTTEYLTLPSVVDRDGELYIIKRIEPWTEESPLLEISPQNGEFLDNEEMPIPLTGGSGATFIADEETNSWWVVN